MIRRILLVTLLAVTPAVLAAAPASACHPTVPPLPDLGCPHCVRVGDKCIPPSG